MKELLDAILNEIKELRKEQIELIKKAEVHNELLKTHEARSLALQEANSLLKQEFENRIKPIEDHVKFLNNSAKLASITFGLLCGIAGLVLTILKGINLFF